MRFPGWAIFPALSSTPPALYTAVDLGSRIVVDLGSRIAVEVLEAALLLISEAALLLRSWKPHFC
jgi:hypothetical protein